MPDGTLLTEVVVEVFLDEAWQPASCTWGETQLVCETAVSSPLVDAPYAYRISDDRQERIGVSLPAGNLCLVFGP